MVLVHFDTMASTSAGLQPWPATVEMGSVGLHPLLVHVPPPPQVKFKFGFTRPRGPPVILATFESMLFFCTAATNWPLDKNTSIMSLSKPRCCICCRSAWVSHPAVHLTGGWRIMIDHSMPSFVSCVNFNTHRTSRTMIWCQGYKSRALLLMSMLTNTCKVQLANSIILCHTHVTINRRKQALNIETSILFKILIICLVRFKTILLWSNIKLGRLVHDHELSWLTHAPKFEVSSYKTSNFFVNKYLTTNQKF